MKKHLKKLVLLMILGMGIVSSSTLSTFNKGFYNSQEVVVDKKLLKLTKGNDVENLSSMSYIDNYIPQEKEEVEIEEENLIDENVSIFSLYSTSNNQYTDNGHGDDKPTGATKIDYNYGTITGKLNKNDGWTQFWNGVGERDEDHFRFTLPEKLKMVFLYSGPSNYNMRILNYATLSFVCTSQSKIEIELNPGTYYLHIYTNETESIVDQNYIINYSSSRISNQTSFLLTDSTKEKYKMALWENEIFPKNAVRYTKTEQTLKYIMKPRRGTTAVSGYVDPLFLTNEDKETLTNQVYLDSVLYAWGKNELLELHDELNKTYSAVKKAVEDKDIQDMKAEFIENTVSVIFTIAGFSKTLEKVVTITTTILTGKSFVESAYRYFFGGVSSQELNELQIGHVLGIISSALTGASKGNLVVKIPRYYYFKKVNGNVGNNTLKTYSWKLMSTFLKGDFDNDETYYFSSSTINYLQSFDNINYHGNIIAFDNNQKYNDYINGKGNGTSLGNHTIHEYNNVKDSDANNHILFCDCGYQKIEKHKNYYDTESGTYSCEYCGHKYSIISNSISKEKYGYTNEYNLKPIDEYIMGGDGKAILTKRLRCAYVDNYLVMSAKSNDANLAYLEYDFDYQVVEFNYNIALWSDDESLIRNSSIRLEYYNNGWKIKRTFNPKEMSLDKNVLMNYKDIFESGATKVRFIIRTNLVQNSNNRGRMVIGDIDYKYGV